MTSDDQGQKPGPLRGNAPSLIGGTVRLDGNQILAQLRQQQQDQPQRGSLLVIAGSHADVGMHLVVEETVVIGRDAVGLQLHDGGISRSHASVERRGAQVRLRDLGSTNGTLVNGVPLHGERLLAEGDKILVGQTVLKFTLVDETEASYLRQVAHLVGTDDLTGLMSKHRFDAVLKESVRAAIGAGQPLAALMMDMDGLKAVNDRHGHHAGAETIRRVGALIGDVLVGRGEACRFGGDEFTAFLAGVDEDGALAAAEQIRAAVQALPLEWQGARLAVTISIGVAALDATASGPTTRPLAPDLPALLHRADEALYRAKAAGKNRVCR